ncbi:Photosystem I reaction center subunit II (Photosystem I 16 kDa polypeptide) (PSI-D), partial [Durusdinium trenchii]
MHPADGVFPEKVNKGRVQVNGRPFTIRSNPQQSELKWTKYNMKSYEADPLTTLFVKARVQAFQDIPNLFALPQPNMDELVPVEELEKYTKQEYTTRLMEALKRVQDDRKAKEAKSELSRGSEIDAIRARCTVRLPPRSFLRAKEGTPASTMAARTVGLAAVLGVAAVTFVVPSSSAGRRLRAPVTQPASATFGASAEGSSLYSLCSAVGGAALLAAGAAVIRRAEGKEIVAEAIPRPEDLLESPKFPMFEGGTGGYMSKSTRERHAITWTAKEQVKFEMPTEGYAIMNKGENLCYFRKKEQCIALGKQLRKMKIENYKIYRLKKDGTVIFMHPADGVFPEKVNKGRVQVNGRPFTIRSNPQQSELKWTKYNMKSYE